MKRWYGLALTYQAQGHPDRTDEVLNHLADMMPHQPFSLLTERFQVRLTLLRGDTETARRLALLLTFEPEREALMSFTDSPGRFWLSCGWPNGLRRCWR